MIERRNHSHCSTDCVKRFPRQRAARLCDLYGVDTISTGGTLAWAMECSEHGLLPEARELGLRFGQADALLAAIPAIAERRGVGALLAEGSKRAACEIGGESLYWAMHVKGLWVPGYEPRSLKTAALGLAVRPPAGPATTGPNAYDADLSGRVDRFLVVPARNGVRSWLKRKISPLYLTDSPSCASFYAVASLTSHTGRGLYYWPSLSRVGISRVPSCAAPVSGSTHLKKLFNLRQGWRPRRRLAAATLVERNSPDWRGPGCRLNRQRTSGDDPGILSGKGMGRKRIYSRSQVGGARDSNMKSFWFLVDSKLATRN